MKFTFETETENCFSFLDIKINVKMIVSLHQFLENLRLVVFLQITIVLLMILIKNL